VGHRSADHDRNRDRDPRQPDQQRNRHRQGDAGHHEEQRRLDHGRRPRAAASPLLASYAV
jgi:hypothetical protein